MNTVAPGARILVRDAEWVVRRVDRTSTGGQAISALRNCELVKDKEALLHFYAEKPKIHNKSEAKLDDSISKYSIQFQE